jgi:hypothetical protein
MSSLVSAARTAPALYAPMMRFGRLALNADAGASGTGASGTVADSRAPPAGTVATAASGTAAADAAPAASDKSNRRIAALARQITELKAQLAAQAAPANTDDDDDAANDPKAARRAARERGRAAAEAELQPKLTAAQTRAAALEARMLSAEVRSVAAAADCADPELLQTLIGSRVRLNDQGEVVVIDADGEESDLSLSDLVSAELAKRPYLVKAKGVSGAGFSGTPAPGAAQGDVQQQIAAAITAGNYAEAMRLEAAAKKAGKL